MRNSDVVDTRQILSSLPSVDELLKSPNGLLWLAAHPRRLVVQAVRDAIQSCRQAILSGSDAEISPQKVLAAVEHILNRRAEFSLRPVINATGIVIHTNLGRSVLSEEVIEHVRRVACSYSTLEYDLVKGKRGKRYSHIQEILREITGAERGIVVNNNAAAVLVCLNTLAKGKEVIVSRGELVEIGGSFRIPEVMGSSGATLKEVGTTNKTHTFDYERAISENTTLILKVHQSNYRMVGFTALPSIEELVALGRKHGIPVMYDLGSGSLVDLKPYGVHIEPPVQEIVKSGADLVTFSGDKLLGGPQGGVIVGRADLIERIAKNPLMRAVRVDKLTLSAFEATLRVYLDEEAAKKQIPTLRLLFQDIGDIKKRARRLVTRFRKIASATVVQMREDSSQAGGGSLPEVGFRTYVVAVKPLTMTVNQLEERLRLGQPPVIARIHDDALIFDARTILDKEIDPLVGALVQALAA
jgi:L-seryl-tRNA(Ser) seleniumtransferase